MNELEKLLFDFWNKTDQRLDDASLDEFHSGEIVKEEARLAAEKIKTLLNQ